LLGERRSVSGWGSVRVRSVVVVIVVCSLAGCAGEEGSGYKSVQEERGSQPATVGKSEPSDRQKEPTVYGYTSMITAQSAEGTALVGETTGQVEDTSGSSERSEERTDEDSGLLPSDTLVLGARDMTGGPLTEHRLVSYYGHPLSGAMGVLGQYEPEAMIEQLKEQAEAYTRIDPERPAIPTIELIASVAQPTPGPDGLYLKRTAPRFIEEYSRLAKENGCLLLLDVQIGYSTIADEIEVLMPYLEREHVHLAIDPEYDMSPGEIPGQHFGSSTGEEIMDAARTLSDLVESEDLPPKVLVIHQFQYDMIINKRVIEPVPNVEIVIHADGFGTRRQKIKKYNLLVRDQPVQYGGFKLFYHQDYNLLSPEEVLDVLEPNPAVVSYQ
jgi:hypothetical protein